MKRIVTLLGVLLLVAALIVGCSKPSSTPPPSTTPAQTQPAQSAPTEAVKVDWPTKPITAIVAANPGGSVDLMTRVMAPYLEKELGQPIVIKNVPGSASWIGYMELINSKPDGYTFGCVTVPSILIAKYDDANPRKEGRESIDPLINQILDSSAIAIRKDDTRYHDFVSFIEYAKTHEVLSAAGGKGILNGDSSAMEYFNMKYGTKITTIPVSGSGDSEMMFIAGDSDVYFGGVSDTRVAHERGDYKVVTVLADERSPLLPDVPTIAELGFEPFSNCSARGYAFPVGVDPAIKEKMVNAMEKAISNEECIKKMAELGAATKIYKGKEYEELMDKQLISRLSIYGKTK